MSLLVPSIVEVSMNKIAMWINVCVDDWIAELVIIANNELHENEKNWSERFCFEIPSVNVQK